MVSTLFIQRELNAVQDLVVEQDFPEMLMASGALVPISTALPAGAESYTYKILTYLGTAAILANGADDIPMINAYAEERIGVIRTLADGYEYTINDFEAAQLNGMSIDAAMAVGAREALEQKFDLLAYTGDSNFNLLGLINYPNILSYTVLNDGNQNGGTNSTRWRHKTAEQIFRDLREFAAYMPGQTNGVESMEVIVLPQEQYEIIAATPYPSSSAAGTTILTFFLQTQAARLNGVTAVIPVPYLAGKGASSTDVMMGYRRRDNKIRLHMPLDFDQQPVQQKNFTYRVPCRMKTGGIQVLKPRSLAKAEGI